ncbi:MAG: efflux transporter outer membrane subunit [Micavibrio sp.]
MKKSLALICSALLMSSCAMTPVYERPDVQMLEAWHSESLKEQVAINYDWWTNFGSEELNGFMQQALTDNNDLKAGIYRIEQSRASLKAAGASLYPSVDASAGASRSRTDPDSGRTSYDTSLRAGAGVSYELDLFGSNQAGVEAAEANLLGTQLDHESLLIVTMGDVARQYFNILNLRSRLAIADKNLDIAREVLRIVQARLDVGTETALALAQQKSALASAEAARISIAEQATNAENAFAILLGQPPQAIAVGGKSLSALKVPAIAAGQPSDLLERRPDIKAMEMDLRAANADIGAARAAFFPSINLGLDSSIAATGFGDPATIALALASSLTAPIFSGGRLEAGIEQATARQKELVLNYQQAVLVAFQETEDALTAVKAKRQREDALNMAMKEARKSYDLTKQLYEGGSVDFQTVLDTQKTLLSAEDSYTQAKMERLGAAIDLYLALGGGWAQK